MSTDAVRAALAELVAATNPDGETPVADWRKAWAAATAALSEPAPGDFAQWLASVDADGYRTDEERFAARILLRIATTPQEPTP